jgi:choline dehydrogenase-like flavoprotein
MSGGREVVIVGSGAGGSAAAWALTHAGFHVTIIEKGRHLLSGLGTKAGPRTLFGNDEVKGRRAFENPDELLEPRTARSQDEAAQGIERSFVGDVNGLPTVVGGGTIHWDAKTPRFWRQDFKTLSTHGPVPGANLADWPLTYDDLAPFYDEVEQRLGCQGDIHQIPSEVLAQAPRTKQLPLPPGPMMYAAALLAEGARKQGLHPYPVSMAVHSRPFRGGQACNNCGFCSGFGCPINARGGAAISFLHDALRHGARLKHRCFVFRVRLDRSGRKSTGVDYLDPKGRVRHQRADVVILAPSAIETARLLLMSRTAHHPHGVGNRSDQLGRNLMFHNFTLAFAHFAGDVHAWVGPNTTITIDDFCFPEKGAPARAAGLPYLKGGICETGGTLLLFDESDLYAAAPNSWGVAHKQLMRSSPLRAHIGGLSMVGEDLPQAANRVDLDPKIRDVYGHPVPRITYSLHRHEIAASNHFGPKLAAMCAAAPGALDGAYVPVGQISQTGGPGSDEAALAAGPASTAHIMGTARMGSDPRTSVCDAHGRVHEVENLFLGDGSVFASAGGFNPSLTIMALSLRMARHVAHTH